MSNQIVFPILVQGCDYESIRRLDHGELLELHLVCVSDDSPML
jgi:hypothetical protein